MVTYMQKNNHFVILIVPDNPNVHVNCIQKDRRFPECVWYAVMDGKDFQPERDDRIVFVSIGGLMPGIELEDIQGWKKL